MKRVRIDFSRLSIPAKVQKARNLVACMSGNPDFANPHPGLEEIVAATDALDAAYEAALNRDKQAVQNQRTCETTLKRLVFLLAAYVQSASKGDEIAILGSGFDVHKEKTPIPVPGAPQNIGSRPGPRDGQLSLRWEGVAGARAYNIQRSRDGQTWEYCGSSTGRRFTVEGQESGQLSFYRVAAISYKGQGAWSDPGVGRAM